MTALAGRRRRSTVLAAAAAAGAIALAGGLAVAGGLTLYHSTDGGSVGPTVAELMFPNTPTALLAGVDKSGALASLAVIVVRPDGAGGSVVPVPVSADATSGEGDERLPIAETVALEGMDVLQREAEIALSLSFDTVEIADEARLAALLEPIGLVDVDFPADVTDEDGDVVAEAGTATADARELAAVLAARDPDVPAVEQYAASAAAWDGIAVSVGDGLPAASPGEGAPGSVERALAAVTAGRLRSRALASSPVDADRNPRDVDAALLDRAELALVFGQIAPGRVAAPNAGLSFQVVAPFSEAQLGDRAWTNAEVAYRAINQVLFLRGNVLSVDTTATEAPTTTRLELNDATLDTEGVRELFGRVELAEPATRLVGVDGVLILGTEYLTFLDGLDVLPGDDPATTDDTIDTAATTEPTTGTDDTDDEPASGTTGG